MEKQKTVDKIKVLGTSGWKKVTKINRKILYYSVLCQPLHEAVPIEILPPQWGGTNMQFMEEVGHERTGICMGGEVPLYYQSVQQPQEIPGEDLI